MDCLPEHQRAHGHARAVRSTTSGYTLCLGQARCKVSDSKPEHPLARVYDWMLRRRLIHEPQWGQPGFAQRLIRIRLASALVLSLPAIVVCVWYSLIALTAHVGHKAELNLQEPLTPALFQLHLHDRLMRDWQRLRMPEPKRKSVLPTLGLALEGNRLDELDSRLPPDDGAGFYVDGFLIRNNRAHEVQVRYRGGKYWHSRHPQKSWKVRVKDGKAVGGFETFSLLNPPEAVPFEEQLILEIARERGLITPEHFPVRLLLNKDYMGVYFFEGQPDAGLLRRAGRAEGSVYSGSEAPIDTESGVSLLFRSADYFTKVANGVHQQLGDRSDLGALLKAVNDSTVGEFAEYASRHLDVAKFAEFDALDVMFGCNQHDFGDNHKLYFDPYRGRFEPIGWNYRGCKHENAFNRTENPLLLRLKQLPGYLTHRNRSVYQLAKGVAAPESLRERIGTLLDKLQADQTRDPHWDAHQLLPPMTPYYAQLLRPLTRELQGIAIETRLRGLRMRQRYVTSRLERHEVSAMLSSPSKPAQGTDAAGLPQAYTLDITVAGDAGYRVSKLEPHWGHGCTPPYWQLFADTQLDDRLDPRADESLSGERIEARFATLSVEVYPGVRFESRRVHPTRGRLRAVSDARRYRLFLRAPRCEPAGATLLVENLVTGATNQLNAAVHPQRQAHEPDACVERYREEAGYSSPHPWCLPRPRSELIHVGPGLVHIEQTHVFAEHQNVVIAPGTTLRMGSGASLIFYGPLDASGSPERPIRFEPLGQTWGGVVLQGPGTTGSRLSHVQFADGTRPDSDGTSWPGVVNIHDTERVTVEHCLLDRSPRARLGFHLASVQQFEARRFRVAQIGGNAIEIEHSTAMLERLAVTATTRGGLVATGSKVVLKDSRIADAGACAISARRASILTVQDTLVAKSGCGLEAVEASTLDQQRVLLYRDNVGARLESNDDRFPGKAHLKGGVLHAVDCKVPFEVEAKRQKLEQRVITQLQQSDLEFLRTQVLEIPGWDALDKAIAGLVMGVLW